MMRSFCLLGAGSTQDVSGAILYFKMDVEVPAHHSPRGKGTYETVEKAYRKSEIGTYSPEPKKASNLQYSGLIYLAAKYAITV